MYAVTLKQLRDAGACVSGYNKLVSALIGKEFDANRETYMRYAHTDSIALEYIANSNGIDDAIWCLRAVPGCDKDARLFAVWCARQVQHLMLDERSITAVDVAERFANGHATSEELTAARDAARVAAWVAAWVTAWATAWAAARDAAWDAAWVAARAAARDAAMDAARDAVMDAVRDAQKEMFIKMCNGMAPWQVKA